MNHELLETWESADGTECVCRCGWTSGVQSVRALATGGWYLHFRAATGATEKEAITLLSAMLRLRNATPTTTGREHNIAELSDYLEMAATEHLPH